MFVNKTAAVAAVMSSFRRIMRPSECCLLICDMQEKSRKIIQYFDEITKVTRRLLDAAKILDIKIIASEQTEYEHSVPELNLKANNVPIFEKTKFSMCIPELEKELEKDKTIKSIILCGIEAHVCVFHTALDLLEKNYDVHIVVDATSSRSMTDRIFAYKQLERAGAVMTTSECLIMSLVGDSTHKHFQSIRELILETAPDTGLLKHASLV